MSSSNFLIFIFAIVITSLFCQGTADVTCFTETTPDAYHCISRNKDGILRQLPGTLKSVTTIFLNNSAIRNIDDSEFHQLSTVKKLYLNDNNLSVISAQWFIKLKELLLINLARNYISIVPVGIFHHCPMIRLIDLSGNKIKKFKDTSDHFANTIFDFSFNPLVDFEVGTVDTLYLNYTTLEELHLKKSVVNIFAPHSRISNFSLEITNSKRLETLDLRNNNLTDIKNISILQGGPTYLDLSQNYFGTLSPNAFLGLNRLRFLNLSQTVMLNLFYGMFWNQENLKVLDMSNNHLWSLDTQKLYPAQLQELYIQNNTIYKIEDPGKMLFNLKRLGIAGNSLSCKNLFDIYSESMFNGVKLYIPSNLIYHADNNIAGMACSDSS